jgi:hypothetical protein
MESKEINRIKIGYAGKYPEGELIHSKLFFTKDEKRDLKIALKRFNTKKVKKFISHLECYCQDVAFLLKAPSKTDHRAELETILKSFKKSLKHLKRMERGKSALSFQRSMTEVLNGRKAKVKDPHAETDNVNTLLKGLELSWEAYGPLKQLADIIEIKLNTGKQKRGRPESFAVGVSKAIEEIWIQYFEKIPSPAKGGPFSQCVVIALSAVGLEIPYPTKSIEKALNQI